MGIFGTNGLASIRAKNTIRANSRQTQKAVTNGEVGANGGVVGTNGWDMARLNLKFS